MRSLVGVLVLSFVGGVVLSSVGGLVLSFAWGIVLSSTSLEGLVLSFVGVG